MNDLSERANTLILLAQVQHQAGDDAVGLATLEKALDTITQIPDPKARFQQARTWLLFNNHLSIRRTLSGERDPMSPLSIPEPLRERAVTIAVSTLDDIAQSKLGEAPTATIASLVTAASYGSDAGLPPYTPAKVLGLMEKAQALAKTIPLKQRDVAVRSIAMVQVRAGDPDAAIASLRLSADRAFRVHTLMFLASDSGATFLPSGQQSAQRYRLRDAAIAEARGFPPGPDRYKALGGILRGLLSSVWHKEPSSGTALFREMIALIPRGALPPAWPEDDDVPERSLLRLAHLGQHVGDHATARKVLARASAVAIKSQEDSYVLEGMLDNIARAQAFSGDYTGAKNTLQAALKNVTRLRAAGKAGHVFPPDIGNVQSKASFAVSQAMVRDFDGALATARTIPVASSGVRSLALSVIALQMVNARNGKPIEQGQGY